MVLLGPSLFPIHDPELHQHGRFELAYLFFIRLQAIYYTMKNSVYSSICVIPGIKLLQTVNGKTASHGMKEIMALEQCLNQGLV